MEDLLRKKTVTAPKMHTANQRNNDRDEKSDLGGWRLDGTWTERLTEEERRANLMHAGQEGFTPS